MKNPITLTFIATFFVNHIVYGGNKLGEYYGIFYMARYDCSRCLSNFIWARIFYGSKTNAKEQIRLAGVAQW